MALYLGNDKVKINLDGVIYCLNILTATPTILDNILLSSDNYILQDLNGLCLIPKDSILPSVDGLVLSSDNYILQDLNGLYLTIKENE